MLTVFAFFAWLLLALAGVVGIIAGTLGRDAASEPDAPMPVPLQETSADAA